MPRREDAEQFSMQLTPEEKEALENEAKNRGLKLTTFVRKLFSDNIPNFVPAIKDQKNRKKPV